MTDAVIEAAPPDATLATYRIETPLALDRALGMLAGEGSTGTFVPVPGETDALKARFASRIDAVRELPPSAAASLPSRKDPGNGATYRRVEVDVSIPLEATGTQLTAILAAVAGNVFELGEVTGMRLTDLRLPRAVLAAHPGPAHSVTGTRSLSGVPDGPIIGTIIKPSIGLTPEQTAQRAGELAVAGLDFIKDDELLAGPAYSPLQQRVQAVMPVLRQAADRAGRQVMYAFNITADTLDEMLRNHDLVHAAGGTCVMVSMHQVGVTGVRTLRERCRLPIHGHRNGWAQLTRAPALGLEFRVMQQVWRLAGIDHLHVNGIGNKFWESDESVMASLRSCLQPLRDESDRAVPVISSGQWGGQAPATLRRGGTQDLMYLAGGGIQGHPGGIAAGVSAVRAAWQAARDGVDLADAARDVPELAAALDAFGATRRPV